MVERTVMIPNADHPIIVEPTGRRIVVTVDHEVIADTTHAVVLREAGCPEIHYIPRADVDMSTLTRSTLTTHCPYKGEASYYSIPSGGKRSTNAIWTYEAPLPAVAGIKDHLAFFPNRVSSIVSIEL